MKLALYIFFYTQTWALSTAGRASRIIGGQEAYSGQFPYAAAIYKATPNGQYFCVGSILSTEWVITAGQCVDGATLFTILIGTHKLDGDEATLQRLATSDYVLHPAYNPTTLANDIGLIKFRSPISYNDYIKRVYLPLNKVATGAGATAIGWGQLTDDDSELSNTLHQVRLSAVSDSQCRITYGGQLLENMICFEGNYNEGTCLGDSGSPIVQSVKGVYDVVVAVSTFFSANGCESTDPSGYTQVHPYKDWIKSLTGVSS